MYLAVTGFLAGLHFSWRFGAISLFTDLASVSMPQILELNDVLLDGGIISFRQSDSALRLKLNTIEPIFIATHKDLRFQDAPIQRVPLSADQLAIPMRL